MPRHLLLSAWLLFGTLAWADTAGYGYPFANPYEATVFGTPREDQAPLPEKVPVESLKLQVLPQRRLPAALWYAERLEYAVLRQDHKAPLVFAIAGTGASANSQKMQILQQALYQAGFHVITLPSPTHPIFVASASLTGVPGDLQRDASDLYHAMQRSWEWARDQGIQVTAFHLTGFSLGAAQAPFIAKLDDSEQIFHFAKVLMINPPVDVYASVVRLDGLLTKELRDKKEDLPHFFNRMMNSFVATYQTSQQVEFNDDLFYEVYRQQRLTLDDLGALIGLSFRTSSANMIFASDLVTNFGYIKPKDCCIALTDSTTEFFKVAIRTNLIDYFNEYFLPYYQDRQPGLSRAQLLEKLTLKSIAPYLATNTRISAVTNEDDIILAPGDLDYLRKLLGPRLKIYPHGGHGGNIAYKANVADLINFFKN